jgi:hypothetical protein
MNDQGAAGPVRLAEEDVAQRGFMQLGSLRLNVHASRAEYLETLGSLFRQSPALQLPRPGMDVDAEVYLVSRARDSQDFRRGPMPIDGSVARWEPLDTESQELFTGRLRVVLQQRRSPWRIVLVVREPQHSQRAFRDHLFEVVTKVLFAVGRVYVHAAAVEQRGRVDVFVGQGSFGKTTVSVRLAQAGATILSEDHVLFAKAGRGFVLSGCQESIRVTHKTEQHVFGSMLTDVPASPLDGKKEVAAERFFRCAPYRDFPFQRIFFNHVGETLRARPITRQEAMLRLFTMTRSFRSGAPEDLQRYLDYLAQLVEGREVFDLELSPDLDRLDDLVGLLGA